MWQFKTAVRIQQKWNMPAAADAGTAYHAAWSSIKAPPSFHTCVFDTWYQCISWSPLEGLVDTWVNWTSWSTLGKISVLASHSLKATRCHKQSLSASCSHMTWLEHRLNPNLCLWPRLHEPLRVASVIFLAQLSPHRDLVTQDKGTCPITSESKLLPNCLLAGAG